MATMIVVESSGDIADPGEKELINGSSSKVPTYANAHELWLAENRAPAWNRRYARMLSLTDADVHNVTAYLVTLK